LFADQSHRHLLDHPLAPAALVQVALDPLVTVGALPVSAFAFGGGVAVAVELVKMLAHFFTEAAAEEKKFKEEIKAFGVEAAKSVGAATREVDKLIMSMRGASAAEMFFFDKVGPELEKQFKIEQQLIKANQTLSKAREDAKYATQSEEELNAATEKERKAVEMLTAALKAKKAEIEGLRSQERRVGAADDTKKGQELSDEKETEEEQHQLRLLQIKTQGLQGEAKILADFRAKEREINNREDATEEQKTAEVIEARKALWRELTTFYEKETNKKNAAISKAEYEAALAIKKLFDEKEDKKLKKFEDNQHKLEQALQQTAGKFEQFGQIAGDVLAGLATHSKSLAGAFAEISKQIAKDVIKMAIIQIKANAGIAGAEAASSQASIPFAGPFLAIAAMGLVEGAVLGLLSLVPSASGGWDIPKGINPIAQVHSGEMILPERYADVIRGIAGGGGGGLALPVGG